MAAGVVAEPWPLVCARRWASEAAVVAGEVAEVARQAAALRVAVQQVAALQAAVRQAAVRQAALAAGQLVGALQAALVEGQEAAAPSLARAALLPRGCQHLPRKPFRQRRRSRYRQPAPLQQTACGARPAAQ